MPPGQKHLHLPISDGLPSLHRPSLIPCSPPPLPDLPPSAAPGRSQFYDPASGEPFAFSDVYDPLTFSGARSGEARVWSFFSKVTSLPNFAAEYLPYASGQQLARRMPFSVPVAAKLKPHDLMLLMRDHYEATPLNMTSDVGAGPWAAKFRDRPLSWAYGGSEYVNERTIGTQQASWHFVANLRSWLPDAVGGAFEFVGALLTPCVRACARACTYCVGVTDCESRRGGIYAYYSLCVILFSVCGGSASGGQMRICRFTATTSQLKIFRRALSCFNNH